MNIYTYDPKTLEYKQTLTAEADPEETKLQGKFVALIPAYATLTAPPEFAQNQIPVFESGEWVIKADYRKNYKLVDDNFMVSDIKDIGKPAGAGYIVDLETSEEIRLNPDRFKIINGNVVKKSDTEYKTNMLHILNIILGGVKCKQNLISKAVNLPNE